MSTIYELLGVIGGIVAFVLAMGLLLLIVGKVMDFLEERGDR